MIQMLYDAYVSKLVGTPGIGSNLISSLYSFETYCSSKQFLPRNVQLLMKEEKL